MIVHAEALDVVVITLAKVGLLPILLILLERGSTCTLLAMVLPIKTITLAELNKKKKNTVLSYWQNNSCTSLAIVGLGN